MSYYPTFLILDSRAPTLLFCHRNMNLSAKAIASSYVHASVVVVSAIVVANAPRGV